MYASALKGAEALGLRRAVRGSRRMLRILAKVPVLSKAGSNFEECATKGKRIARRRAAIREK